MWKSVFLHEFPDARISNFNAIGGVLAADSSGLTLRRTGPNNTYSLPLEPNRGIGYQFENSRDDVIGFSTTLEIRFPAQSQLSPVPLLQIGTSISLHMNPLGSFVVDPVDGDSQILTNADLVVTAGGTSAVVAKLRLPHRHYVTLRVQCSNDGQVRVFQNGSLIAYRTQATNFSPVSVASIRFGFPTGPAGRVPRYEVSLAFLRLLRREDKIAEVGSWLPEVKLPDDPLLKRCTSRALTELPSMIDKLREHMNAIRNGLASDWDNVPGASNGPFTREGLRLHETAKKLVKVFRAILKGDGSAAPDDFISVFKSLVVQIQEQDPQAYKNLLVQLSNNDAINDECRKRAMELLASEAPELIPITTMLAEASKTAEQVGGN